MPKLGKKIKSLRQTKGWSQGDIALKLGISVAAFSKIETDVTDISISRLEQLSEIFEITLGELILPSTEAAIQVIEQLKKTRDLNEAHLLKIAYLQEYIITLYEQLYPTKNTNIAPS